MWEGHRNRDGVAAKLDWPPMNGVPEQGQWWGRDVAPTLLGRLDFLGNQKSEGGQNVHLLTDAECWRERGGCHCAASDCGQRPTQRSLPKGNALQGQGL